MPCPRIPFSATDKRREAPASVLDDFEPEEVELLAYAGMRLGEARRKAGLRHAKLHGLRHGAGNPTSVSGWR